MSGKNTPKERRASFAVELQRHELDAAFISNPRHIFYFTGFYSAASTLTSSLLITKSNESVLFTGITEERTARSLFDEKMRNFNDYKLEERMISYTDYVVQELRRVLVEEKEFLTVKKLGIEDWHIPHAYVSMISQTLKDVKLTGISDIILKMRKTKGSDEIEKITQAVHRLETALKLRKAYVKPGLKEIDIYNTINTYLSKKHGSIAIVTGAYQAGKIRSVDPFGAAETFLPTKKILRKHDTVVLDLATSVDNYWADMTRTFFVGKKTEKQKRAFEQLLEILEKAEQLLRPGTKGKEIFDTVTKGISKSGFASSLIHHAGHGIGLEVQEPPFFLPSSEDTLEEGVVCALEPGIYNPAVGGMRIEDNYIITKDGFKRIPNVPLNLV